jgi:ADP-ribose pyrophosphatase YjhB (NUDIX family)
MEKINKKDFELCVRAIIRHNGKILVCQHKGKNYYFFPGGHINFGETAEDALKRELNEELYISINKFSFIGAIENIFKEEGREHHELDLVFDVKAKNVKDRSKEDHIDFVFFDTKRFAKETIFPLALRDNIVKWLKDGKIFWDSQIEK